VRKQTNAFQIELPSWGFANTGTRFGKFLQPAAASTTEEKFSDAGEVHRLTGVCPTIALHVLWDLPEGATGVANIKALAEKFRVRPGSINPNVFQDQLYKYGSVGSPVPVARTAAMAHLLESADLAALHERLAPDQRMLVEYKPFEPAFYHTDIADWGMALLLAKKAGPKAKVLVDTGHHYQGQNIEQIVAWLLGDDMLGGFHFNDRRYADDDLTLGSIDPYQIFRIFHEIFYFAWETGKRADVAYMIDQSHNLKGKIEAMIQTVTTAQELYAKAAIVDHEKLAACQAKCALVDAEVCLKEAFSTDVRPAIREWARSHGLPEDPLDAFRKSGYLERITEVRCKRNAASVSSYA